MEPAEKLSLVASGVFFLTGLGTGAWKYQQTVASPEGRAHPYVDIAHRAALLYSFAALVIARFAALSVWGPATDLAAAAAPLAYFAVAIASYVLHGVRKDTDNQFRGAPPALRAAMLSLIVAETGGFAVLFAGFVRGL